MDDDEYKIIEPATVADTIKKSIESRERDIKAREAAKVRSRYAEVDLECILAHVHQIKAYIMTKTNTKGISPELADEIRDLLDHSVSILEENIDEEEKEHGN